MISFMFSMWAATWQNQQNECAPVKTQISLGICPVWSESSLCAQWVAKDPMFLHADSEDSDQTGRSGCPGWSECSLYAHPFCWFCHVAAHVFFQPVDCAGSHHGSYCIVSKTLSFLHVFHYMFSSLNCPIENCCEGIVIHQGQLAHTLQSKFASFDICVKIVHLDMV